MQIKFARRGTNINSVWLNNRVINYFKHFFVPSAGYVKVCKKNKKLRYRRGTAWRAVSVEILSTAAQLYEKSHLKRLTVGKWLWKWLKIIGITTIWYAIYYFLLRVYINNDSTLHHFRHWHYDIYSVLVWLWPWEVVHFRKKTLEITSHMCFAIHV